MFRPDCPSIEPTARGWGGVSRPPKMMRAAGLQSLQEIFHGRREGGNLGSLNREARLMLERESRQQAGLV